MKRQNKTTTKNAVGGTRTKITELEALTFKGEWKSRAITPWYVHPYFTKQNESKMKPNRYQNSMLYQLKVIIISLFESTAVNWASCHLAHITLGPLRYVTSVTNYSSPRHDTKEILFACSACISAFKIAYCQAAGILKVTKYSFFFRILDPQKRPRDIKKMAGCYQSGKICVAFLQIHEKWRAM